MSVAQTITEKLENTLKPQVLKLEDESHMHAGHAGHDQKGESHFQLLIVADAFNGVSRVQRQRMVYDILAEELKERVHALALKTMTPEEYGK